MIKDDVLLHERILVNDFFRKKTIGKCGVTT
jgi:hypothetical protein